MNGKCVVPFTRMLARAWASWRAWAYWRSCCCWIEKVSRTSPLLSNPKHKRGKGGCRKRMGLDPIIIRHWNSNGKQSKRTYRGRSTHLEGSFSPISFPSGLYFSIAFNTAKGRISSINTTSIFSIQSSRRKLKGSIIVSFLCDNRPSKQQQL